MQVYNKRHWPYQYRMIPEPDAWEQACRLEAYCIDNFGKPKPYHFSSISQFARFRGLTDKWYLEVRGNQQRKTVRFNNSVPHRQIVEFALKYLCQVK